MFDMESNRPSRSRRSVKSFKCNIGTCEKVYTRAEHLSRHQLNHLPKGIYHCDVPNCCCSFVRADLYNLHRTRHMSEYLQDSARSKSVSTNRSTSDSPAVMANSARKSDRTFSQGSQARSPPQMFTSASPDAIPPDHGNQENSMIQQIPQDLDIEMQKNKLRPAPMPITTSMMPLFDGDSYSRPPFAIPEDFIQFLFNEDQFNSVQTGDSGFTNYANIDNEYSPASSLVYSDTYLPQSQSNAFNPSYETNARPGTLSSEKSEEIFEFVRYRMVGIDGVAPLGLGTTLLEGDRSSDVHMMGHYMMNRHIERYWEFFHSHFPILHRPSFSPNEVPIILLISIMIIGASCSIESDDPILARSAVEFSKTLAWHLRVEIFRSMHMESSDSLWIYQALLHLELYEKTYSSRALHERAHIHHATTITMMRRGSFLAGKSPLDTPPIYEEQQSNTGNQDSTNCVGDIWWQEWIKREATRRLAFAAFMIDSLHAAMFGHSMTMVTHEMRLTLPCDDGLWSATSGNEVRKIEATLRSNGISPIPFLEGIRRTLNGQEVYTNAFGRSILLCGVLSVSWHMNQRDVQISSLAIASKGGDRGTKWRRSIARAFDLWRDSYGNMTQMVSGDMGRLQGHSDSVLGSRSNLYHLAQFSLNVDIVECQIFAGATRVLGRVIGAHEVNNVQQKIRKLWAPSVDGRKATFYAIRILCLVFRETTQGITHCCNRESIIRYATSANMLPVHRWVLYSAALVLWSYTYAIDGPCQLQIASRGSSIDEHIQQMDAFLVRAENIKSPEDVAFYRLNGCAGLLHVLCYIFRMGTWDLLLEGAELLENCTSLIEVTG